MGTIRCDPDHGSTGLEELGILTRGSGFERLYETLRGVALSSVTLISMLEPVGTHISVSEMNMVI
jgi:hypothetical protein